MADWWLIPDDFQAEIHDHLWELIDRVLKALDKHHNENGVTGALGQTLMDHPLETSRLRVDFDYRKFPESTEEFRTGADGAFIVTVTPPNGSATTKATLFQAKLCKDNVSPQKQTLRSTDAERLKRQVGNMVTVTDDAVGLIYTPDNIYVIDADALNQRTVTQLRRPLRGPQRLISLETYLGKWLPRCARGDARPEFVSMASTPGGFRHLLRMNVTSRIPLLPQAKPDLLLDGLNGPTKHDRVGLGRRRNSASDKG